jgi:hypothetical protein
MGRRNLAVVLSAYTLCSIVCLPSTGVVRHRVTINGSAADLPATSSAPLAITHAADTLVWIVLGGRRISLATVGRLPAWQ